VGGGADLILVTVFCKERMSEYPSVRTIQLPLLETIVVIRCCSTRPRVTLQQIRPNFIVRRHCCAPSVWDHVNASSNNDLE
jgi:hypothetical protein